MENEQIPCLNAGFLVVFPENANIPLLKQQLPPDAVFDYYPDSIYATVAEVKDYYDWEIDVVLTKLFSLCDLEHISEITKMFGGSVHIGIWYYSYGAHPAIILEGENMSIIHKLKANLSIEAY